jgi:tetratricopeptide (TPR) repeat protein
MGGHHFISYSRPEASDFVTVLCDELEASSPDFRAWFDQRDRRPGEDWDEQIAEAIRTCESLVFVMTEDSVAPTSVCKQEWTYALQCKRPITPLQRDAKAVLPFQLLNRQYIDFTGNFRQALAQLRLHLRWLASPEGRLRELEIRLQDARRDLIRTDDDQQQARIQAEINLLAEEIARQRERVEHPEAAAQRARESIERGIELERQPVKPVVGAVHTKFINPPPAHAPSYFQDRHVETELIGTFLQDNTVRLISVVGRGGTGKTAMVCRLLKSLEGGQLPDDGGPLSVDGIVYISRSGSRPVNLPNVYADLAKLLPNDQAARLEGLYKDPQAATVAKMRALLEAFPSGRTVLLLDNFEDVVDPASLNITDSELEEGLRALLQLPEHGVKVIVTTRLAPRSLALVEPGRQRRLDLDEGLSSPYAEQILQAMDADGTLGLKTADAALLNEARIRTRGYPRALETLFAILSADRDTSLPDLLKHAERRNLLPENVVDVLVGEAFSRLDPAAQQVMQALAVFARPVPPAALDHLLQPYIPGMDSAPVLRRLVNMNFVRRAESGRYYLHPVDREYTLSRLSEGEEGDRSAQPPPFTRFALYHQAAEYFEQTRLPRSEWKTIDDLAPQLAEFDLRCEGHDWDSAAWVLLGIAVEYLDVWGFMRLSAQLHERLVGRLEDESLDQAVMGSLGEAYYRMRRYQEALTATERALATARRIEDRQAEAIHVNTLGMVFNDLGQKPKAIEYYQQALTIARDLGNRQGEGIYLGNLGNACADLGDEGRAIECYQQALTIAREIEDRQAECLHLGNLGISYQFQGDVARAVAYHEQSLALARDLGYRLVEGHNLSALGGSHVTIGAFERSMEYRQQALAIFREIADRPRESNVLSELAGVQACMGSVAEATDLCSQALAIARETGEPRSEGVALVNLAEIL